MTQKRLQCGAFKRWTLTFVLFLMMSRMQKASALAATKVKASSSTSQPLNIHWFRLGDLRLHDNPALCRTVEASAKQNESGGILPVFCFDPRIFGNEARSKFGSLKCGARRAKFVLESVADLRQQLEKRGSGLIVAHGEPEVIFEKLLNQIDDSSSAGEDSLLANVFCQEEVCSEEKRVEKAVRSVLKQKNQSSSLETVWGSTLYNLKDLPFPGEAAGMPDVFTPFRNKVEKDCKIDSPLPVPKNSALSLPKIAPDSCLSKAIIGEIEKCSLSYFPSLEDLGYTGDQIAASEPDKRGVMPFKGGETAALARVQEYIWDKDLLKVYFDTRNGMLGGDYSTKFAPWLAHGCLSPRHVAKECRKYEEERVANKSTYWVVFELLWRDFFKFFAVKHGNSIFFPGGTVGSNKRWGLDMRHVQAWKEGRTGYPLVDANMRELAATGFMSNRGRQNVCSFLAIDMNMDWRHGADYFESELLDYDVYSNWGNWCSGAGMTGGRLNRFNIVKQSKDYDCHGEYVRHWLPELKNVPTELIHEPWKMTQFQQMEYGVRLGVDYPNPIVPPSVPRAKDGRKGGGRKGRNQNERKGGNNNKNRGRGQRKDMKSLKQGTFNIR